jgi:hypothetical protein
MGEIDAEVPSLERREELRILPVVLRHVPAGLRIPTGDDDVSVQGAVAIVFLDALGEDRRTACDEERDARKERERRQPSRGGSCQGSIGLTAGC